MKRCQYLGSVRNKKRRRCRSSTKTFSSETNHAQTLVHGLKNKLSGKNLPTGLLHLIILFSKCLSSVFVVIFLAILTATKSSQTFPSHTHTFCQTKNDDEDGKTARNITSQKALFHILSTGNISHFIIYWRVWGPHSDIRSAFGWRQKNNKYISMQTSYSRNEYPFLFTFRGVMQFYTLLLL